MVQFRLPKNSVVQKGDHFEQHEQLSEQPSYRTFKIYRYDPELNKNPQYDTIAIDINQCGPMILDALTYIKSTIDPCLVFRRSCREGVCGSCAMNIDGTNTLACIKPIAEIKGIIHINPLPHMPVIKDLVPDLTAAYAQYASIKPWLHSQGLYSLRNGQVRERIQYPIDREKIDGLWECILCFCCSTSCPSYWWNQGVYLGPAVLLQAYRFVVDNRDNATAERLDALNDPFKMYRCHTIMNCSKTCPKSLNPAQAIANLKIMQHDSALKKT